MRIQSDTISQAPTPQNDKASGIQPAERFAIGNSQDTVGASYEKVDFSDLARNLGEAVDRITASNASRVHALTAAYQSGRYQVDVNRISQNVVSSSITPR